MHVVGHFENEMYKEHFKMSYNMNTKNVLLHFILKMSYIMNTF